MAAPCVTDTCSVTATVGSDRRLQIAVRLDPTGGLTCGTDSNENAGVRVQIYNDPGTAGALVDECLNGLRRTAAGDLLAVSPRGGLRNMGGVTVDVPDNGADSGDSITDGGAGLKTTNPFDCTTLGIVFGRMEWTYEVTAAGPYNADIRGRIRKDGTPIAAIVEDIGGDTTGSVAPSVKRSWGYFIEAFTAFGGATSTWTATSQHEDSNERNNVEFTGTSSGADLGFRAVVSALYVPFNITGITS